MATLSSILAWRIAWTEELQSVGSKRVGQTERLTLFDGPVVRTLPSGAEGVSSVPCWGAKVPHGSWPKTLVAYGFRKATVTMVVERRQ